MTHIDQGDVDFALRLAKRFARGRRSLRDEFESAALLGLARAARAFDPGRGVKFRTYAWTRVVGAMRDSARHWGNYGRGRAPRPAFASLDDRIPDGGGATFFERVLAGEEAVGWELEYHDEIRGLARRLPRNQRVIFLAHFGRADCRTLKGAARTVGRSESLASQVITAAGASLREALAPRHDVPRKDL